VREMELMDWDVWLRLSLLGRDTICYAIPPAPSLCPDDLIQIREGVKGRMMPEKRSSGKRQNLEKKRKKRGIGSMHMKMERKQRKKNLNRHERKIPDEQTSLIPSRLFFLILPPHHDYPVRPCIR